MAHVLAPSEAAAGGLLSVHATTLGLAAGGLAAVAVLAAVAWRLRGGDDAGDADDAGFSDPSFSGADADADAERDGDGGDDGDDTGPEFSVSYSPASGGHASASRDNRATDDDGPSGAKSPDRSYKNVVRSGDAAAPGAGSSNDGTSGSSSSTGSTSNSSTGSSSSSSGKASNRSDGNGTSGTSGGSVSADGSNGAGGTDSSAGSGGSARQSGSGSVDDGSVGGSSAPSANGGPGTADGTDTRIYGGEYDGGGAAGETCPDCGKEIPTTGDYRFCPFCGMDL